MKTSRIYLLAVTVVLSMAAGSAFAGLSQVPEPASTVTLLGMSLAGLALGRQLLRK